MSGERVELVGGSPARIDERLVVQIGLARLAGALLGRQLVVAGRGSDEALLLVENEHDCKRRGENDANARQDCHHNGLPANLVAVLNAQVELHCIDCLAPFARRSCIVRGSDQLEPQISLRLAKSLGQLELLFACYQKLFGTLA